MQNVPTLDLHYNNGVCMCSRRLSGPFTLCMCVCVCLSVCVFVCVCSMHVCVVCMHVHVCIHVRLCVLASPVKFICRVSINRPIPTSNCCSSARLSDAVSSYKSNSMELPTVTLKPPAILVTCKFPLS